MLATFSPKFFPLLWNLIFSKPRSSDSCSCSRPSAWQPGPFVKDTEQQEPFQHHDQVWKRICCSQWGVENAVALLQSMAPMSPQECFPSIACHNNDDDDDKEQEYFTLRPLKYHPQDYLFIITVTEQKGKEEWKDFDLQGHFWSWCFVHSSFQRTPLHSEAWWPELECQDAHTTSFFWSTTSPFAHESHSKWISCRGTWFMQSGTRLCNSLYVASYPFMNDRSMYGQDLLFHSSNTCTIGLPFMSRSISIIKWERETRLVSMVSPWICTLCRSKS